MYHKINLIVGEHLVGSFLGFKVHVEVMLVIWLTISTILVLVNFVRPSIVTKPKNFTIVFGKQIINYQRYVVGKEKQTELRLNLEIFYLEFLKDLESIIREEDLVVKTGIDLIQVYLLVLFAVLVRFIVSLINKVVSWLRYKFKIINLYEREKYYFGDLFFEYILTIIKTQLDEYSYLPWVPFIGTLFVFILISNWVGALIPWKFIDISQGEFSAPTKDINTTVALSLLTSINYFYAGFKTKGLGFFARYISPVPSFLPINLLEDFSKPLSLSFRLFGNILADEILVSVSCLLIPIFLSLPIMLLGLLTSSTQALVFALLAASYITD